MSYVTCKLMDALHIRLSYNVVTTTIIAKTIFNTNIAITIFF